MTTAGALIDRMFHEERRNLCITLCRDHDWSQVDELVLEDGRLRVVRSWLFTYDGSQPLDEGL